MRLSIRGAACALVLALTGLPAAGAPTPPTASAEPDPVNSPPNIVVIYIDDVAPHDGRLWSDPNLTPTLHEHFVAHGIDFPNAIVENPLCCPARGNLLTGLHTHNNGLDTNDVRRFNPSMHIGRALRGAGYSTMFLGKYLNRADLLTSAQWAAHADGWTHFDVTKGANGQFYNYNLYTRDSGTLTMAGKHSTEMTADRFVLRSRQTPAEQPIFALLSIYNLHAPNTPLPEFVGDPRCAAMAPWKPPNYNEPDMSDKPAFMSSLAPVGPAGGWPMVRFCEEMLGVDKMVKQVVDELEAQARLHNTLLIFTADNGMGWGAHRWGQNKRMPFTTPVPLYMSWPARWGSETRTITEHTSNIDLAPTFCDIAGCNVGPFATGQAGPDGISLLPLIDGEVEALPRDALLETSYVPKFERSWTGLRTTAQHPAGLWHYVEWQGGATELYDLANDPWELENLAGKTSTATLRAELAQRLAALRQEGRPAPQRPDGSIAFVAGGPYKGEGVLSTTPIKAQTRKRINALRGQTYSYFVRVRNAGSAPEAFTLRGTETGLGQMTIAYWSGSTNITSQVVAGTYSTGSLAAGAAATVQIQITVAPRAGTGVKRAILHASPASQPGSVDVVRAILKR